MKMPNFKKAIHLFLACFTGFILGVGLTALCVIKEQYFWKLPEISQEQYIQQLKEANEVLELLNLRLRFTLIQISRDMERIFGEGIIEVTEPESVELFSEQKSQGSGASSNKITKEEK